MRWAERGQFSEEEKGSFFKKKKCAGMRAGLRDQRREGLWGGGGAGKLEGTGGQPGWEAL